MQVQNSSFTLLISMKSKALFLVFKTNETRNSNVEFDINSYRANVSTRFHTSMCSHSAQYYKKYLLQNVTLKLLCLC